MSQFNVPPEQYVPLAQNVPPAQYVSNHNYYGSEPIQVTCFNCKSVVVTNTFGSANTVCCFLFSFFALCCCQDKEHRCPQCNVILGIYHPCC